MRSAARKGTRTLSVKTPCTAPTVPAAIARTLETAQNGRNKKRSLKSNSKKNISFGDAKKIVEQRTQTNTTLSSNNVSYTKVTVSAMNVQTNKLKQSKLKRTLRGPSTRTCRFINSLANLLPQTRLHTIFWGTLAED